MSKIKKTNKIDDTSLISPKQEELPDVPQLDSLASSHIEGGSNEQPNKQLNQSAVIMLVGIIILSGLIIFGFSTLRRMNQNRTESSAELSLIAARLDSEGSGTLVSSDGGNTWSETFSNIQTGMHIKTDGSSDARISFDNGDSFTIGRNSYLRVSALNTIKVSFDIVEGEFKQSATDNAWVNEFTYEGLRFSGHGDMQITARDNKITIVAPRNGEIRHNGVPYVNGHTLTVSSKD